MKTGFFHFEVNYSFNFKGVKGFFVILTCSLRFTYNVHYKLIMSYVFAPFLIGGSFKACH